MHRRCSDWRARYRTQKTGRRMKYSSVPSSTFPFYFFICIFFSPKQKSQSAFLCPSHYNSNAAVVHESSGLMHLVPATKPAAATRVFHQKTKSNLSFRVLLRKVMDHYWVRYPSIFTHPSNLSLCLLHNDKQKDFFFVIALLLRLWLLTFIICMCEDFFNVTVFSSR